MVKTFIQKYITNVGDSDRIGNKGVRGADILDKS